MTEMVGKLMGANRTFDGKSIILSFEVDAAVSSQIENMVQQERLIIRVGKYKKKRSLDANAYAWALMSKIATAVDSSKEEVYENMLQKYGVLYEDEEGYMPITVKKTVDMTKIGGHWKYVKDNGKFASYLMIKGSSEYDTAEMSHFIDRIVGEAKELGIETAPPDELERMKQEWHV